MREKTQTYSHVAITLHWLIAGLILFNIFLGWRFDDLHGLALWAPVQVHKTVGISILALTVLRLVWRLVNRPPPELPMPKIQALAAQAVHVGFYVIMLGLPLTGWAMISAGNAPAQTHIFGLFTLPNLPVPQGKPTHEAFEFAHAWLARLTIFLLLPLHIAGALKHQFFDRDATIERMAPVIKPGFSPWLVLPLLLIVGAYALAQKAELFWGAGGSAPVAAPVALPASAPASDIADEPPESAPASAVAATAVKVEAPRWVVAAAGSSLKFTTSFDGTGIDGAFSKFDADIRFDPDHLDVSAVKATIDLASAASGDDERDGSLKGPDFLNAVASPKATFTAARFKALGQDRYQAVGRLALRGVSKPLVLTFTLKIDGDTAVADGEAHIDRLAFGVGQGQWTATTQIPQDVKVTLHLTAHKQS